AHFLRAVVDAPVLPGERAGGADRPGWQLRRAPAPVHHQEVGGAIAGRPAGGLARPLTNIEMLVLALLIAQATPKTAHLDARSVQIVQILAEHATDLAKLLKLGRTIESVTAEDPETFTTIVRVVARQCHVTIAGLRCKGGGQLTITRRIRPVPDTDGETTDSVDL